MDLKKIKQLVLAFGFILIAMLLLSTYRYTENIKLAKMTEVNSLIISTGTFKTGLNDALYGFGLSEKEKFKICKAYSKFFNLRRLKPNDEYSVITSTSGIVKYVSIRRKLKDYLVFRKGEGFVGSVKPVKVTSEILRSEGVIVSSLWNAMIPTVPAETILDFADVFSWTVDFLTEVRKNDKYTVIYEVKKTDKGRIIDKKILAASYKGSVVGKKTAVKFKDSYYNKKGQSMRSMFLRAPLQYRRISSYFSRRGRYHPILKYVRPHLGIDYAAPTGTPASAVASGRITFKGWKGGYGRFISIKHSSGYSSEYGHLRRYAKGLRVGKRVKQGDVVGYVGTSGLSTGPHLHFNFRIHGKYMNFLKIKYRPTKRLARKYKKEFASLYESFFDK
jgi:murein DD-endopeptidase MepM/ murein hydrolase activator NlpD